MNEGSDAPTDTPPPPTIAPPSEPFTGKKRLAAAPPLRRRSRTLGRRTRSEELPYGIVTRTEIPSTPLQRMSEIALGASIRVATRRVAALRTPAPPFPLRLAPTDLRRKVRSARTPNLVLFVVDGSGSMAARQRMSAVKGAILSLLVDAYQKRDRVGMITFRGTTAEVVLPPTKSILAAQRHLTELPTGGRTPLAEGLRCAYQLLDTATQRRDSYLPLVVLLTDGRANVAATSISTNARTDAYTAAARIAQRGWSSLVIDCEAGYPRLGLATPLAVALRGDCLSLETLSAASLTRSLQPYLRPLPSR
jgi:magnesium chelatase subunit D